MGLVAITAYKISFTGFKSPGDGLAGLAAHVGHEWVLLANLLLLLTGFAVLSRHFEKSRVPDEMPGLLPDDWRGGFLLLVIVFVLSAFLDNIAAALVGGTMARHLFRKVHVGFVVAIVAAANAGGSGSAIGDTTTTMMWIAGVHPASLLRAYVAAGFALLVFGIPAALRQQRFSPILKNPRQRLRIEWTRVFVVAAILVIAVAANVVANLSFRPLLDQVPIIGLAVWAAILVTAGFRRPDWEVIPSTLRSAAFLLALVASASMMPVETLPKAGWATAFGMGLMSAVFDNIPLTAIALKEGGYDWGLLAYAVGFGGSIIWFGSSAGIAVTNMYPDGKSVVRWLRDGWFVAIAYTLGFFAMLGLLGWRPG